LVEVVAETDITPGVLRALKLDTKRREHLIAAQVPAGLRRLFGLWAGTEKSWIYNDFRQGRRSYMMYLARSPG